MLQREAEAAKMPMARRAKVRRNPDQAIPGRSRLYDSVALPSTCALKTCATGLRTGIFVIVDAQPGDDRRKLSRHLRPIGPILNRAAMTPARPHTALRGVVLGLSDFGLSALAAGHSGSRFARLAASKATDTNRRAKLAMRTSISDRHCPLLLLTQAPA